jgi:hypothetical protein
MIFTIVATLALVGMARNFAQKRTVFGDPLSKAAWEKMYQVEHDPARKRNSGDKRQKS